MVNKTTFYLKSTIQQNKSILGDGNPEPGWGGHINDGGLLTREMGSQPQPPF